MEENSRRGPGRPKLEDTINPEWYKIIVDAGKEGKHITEFLITLGISWEGHHALLKRNTKYSEAVDAYKKLCENYWFNMAHDSMSKNGGNGFNSRLWSLIVRNKFPEHWSESTKIDVSTMGEKLNSNNKIEIEILKTKHGEKDNDAE
jgi:hypothetical protein